MTIKTSKCHSLLIFPVWSAHLHPGAQGSWFDPWPRRHFLDSRTWVFGESDMVFTCFGWLFPWTFPMKFHCWMGFPCYFRCFRYFWYLYQDILEVGSVQSLMEESLNLLDRRSQKITLASSTRFFRTMLRPGTSRFDLPECLKNHIPMSVKFSQKRWKSRKCKHEGLDLVQKVEFHWLILVT